MDSGRQGVQDVLQAFEEGRQGGEHNLPGLGHRFDPRHAPVSDFRLTAAQSTFRWRYELNGFVQSSDETFENDKIPKTFDSIIVGYTNSRSYTTLKLQHVKTVVNGRRI